jgi:hypothetical protein
MRGLLSRITAAHHLLVVWYLACGYETNRHSESVRASNEYRPSSSLVVRMPGSSRVAADREGFRVEHKAQLDRRPAIGWFSG